MMLSTNLKFVFIVGCQRTGTTLVGNILGAHSQAFLIDEPNGVYQWVNSILDGQDIEVSNSLFTSCCQKARNNYLDPETKCTEEGSLSAAVTHIILKAPNLTYSAKKLARNFPGSFCIFTFRDIRDVVVSMSKLDWIPMVKNQLNLIKNDAEMKARYQKEILELEKPGIPPHLARAYIARIKMELSTSFNIPNLEKLEVRYEDLVKYPGEWMEKLFHHIQLPANLQKDTYMNSMKGWGPGLTFRRNKINTFSVSQWPNFLSVEQENDIWQIAGSLMQHLRYKREPDATLNTVNWDNINSDKKYRPIIATGRGGSGTRLLSLLLQSLGVFIGNKKNKTEDSLEWTGLFYKIAVERIRQKPPRAWVHWRQPLQSTAAEILTLKNWDGVQPWGWKLPETMLILPEIFNAFDQGVFIHIVRHPVDCSLRRTHVTSRANNPVGKAVLQAAYKNIGWQQHRIATDPNYLHNAASWHYQVSGACRFGRDELGPERYFEVKYEDICRDPAGVLKALSSFLKIQGPPKALDLNIDPERRRSWSTPDPRADEVWEVCGELAMGLGYQRIDDR